ncbi:DUF2950 domain-containing protein [Pararobbsia alpina]|uniref:DUF2950 domain-containing protein n=1 Tax=Pararobbsia alpina TaxID=621374 RepID=A0A6S7B9D9_9BURK|nr:DUF2950 domain-containing protein [Pararobbsia alpina]CAB3791536.1 hypothetical protein LMG28138_03179 [Pararobbsia alpina]
MTRFRPSYVRFREPRNTSRPAAMLTALATIAALSGMAGNVSAQAVYPSPEQAAEALQQAIALDDDDALKKVLGANYVNFIPVGSVGEDDIYAFLGAYAKHHEVVRKGEDVAHLQAGDSGWTLPIPIEKTSKGWHFEVKQAHDEMADRRIGRNELSAIQTVLAIGDAQRDFAAAQGSTVYAQRFVSHRGKRDGLYWPVGKDEPESPLGALAAVMDPTAAPGQAYHGYHYRILSAQGTHAPGGARSYIDAGKMSGGYAVLAWPAKYGDTGVMTFVAGSDGKVYQRDFGSQSASAAARIKTFDPGPGWEAVPDTALSAQ